MENTQLSLIKLPNSDIQQIFRFFYIKIYLQLDDDDDECHRIRIYGRSYLVKNDDIISFINNCIYMKRRGQRVQCISKISIKGFREGRDDFIDDFHIGFLINSFDLRHNSVRICGMFPNMNRFFSRYKFHKLWLCHGNDFKLYPSFITSKYIFIENYKITYPVDNFIRSFSENKYIRAYHVKYKPDFRTRLSYWSDKQEVDILLNFSAKKSRHTFVCEDRKVKKINFYVEFYGGSKKKYELSKLLNGKTLIKIYKSGRYGFDHEYCIQLKIN